MSKCDYCGDGLSFSFGEVDTVSFGRSYHSHCYQKNVKSSHDKYREERNGL